MNKKAYDVFKRDSLLLEFMREHKGEQNLVSSKDICHFLKGYGYQIKECSICTVINKIMYERNAPICYSNAKGYYWASNRNEIQKTIEDMQKRINSLLEHIEHLKSFIVE